MNMNEDDFTSSFVREYLRYIQKKRSTITGLFHLENNPIIWGSVSEYGVPPYGGLIVEMGPANDPQNSNDYRFWYARETRSGLCRRDRDIMRDELSKVLSDG
jgi:hypothetical protein